ncbi:MAG: hypothetical protein AXW15_10300 [Neptuniibacter sp. Phe_28]|nr:MAG: hypothetical protein AXW15_10300 [Neptuniibacter sp. Phe_28]
MYLDTESYLGSENLARKIITKTDENIENSSLVNQLFTYANSRGGFGESEGHHVTVLDTATVLDALSHSGNVNNSAVSSAVAVLLSRQSGDGGWAEGVNEESVYLTSLVMNALVPFKDSQAGVTEALSLARNFLLSRRDASGLWSSDLESAHALLALSSYVSDISSIRISAESLLSKQGEEGSWGEDVYTTAVALRALGLFQSRSGGNSVGTGTITGYVVTAGTSQPISGATVSLVSEAGAVVASGADGYFVITGVEAGEQTVVAQKTGYIGSSSIITVYSDQSSSLTPLVLGRDEGTSIVSGRVTDSNGFGVGAAVVSLEGASNYSVSTDAEGYYELLAVLPGNYSFSIEKAGYYTPTGTASTVAAQHLIINQKLIKEGVFLNSDPGSLYGLVIDATNNQPIAGATFTISGGETVVTGSDGRFVTSDLARDTYIATLELEGYASLSMSILYTAGIDGDMGALTLYRLDGSAAATTLTVIGSVVDGLDNSPIAGAVVERVDTGESWVTDSSGGFNLTGITELNVQLSISADGHESRLFSVTSSAFGEIEQKFVLPLISTGGIASTTTLSGTVNDAVTGAGLENVSVALNGGDYAAITDNNGYYQITGVDLLEFSLTTSALGYTGEMRQVSLSSHGAYQVNIELEKRPELATNIYQIISLSQPQAAVPANSELLFEANIANLTAEPQEALLIAEVYNANGESVAEIAPYAEGTNIPQTLFGFSAEETKVLTVAWNTSQFPAGSYRVVLRVVEKDSISRSLPTGIVLAEYASTGGIVDTAAIGGDFDFSPPLTQAGSQTPVSLNALVINKGNIPLDGVSLTLTIADPESGVIVHSATAVVDHLDVSNHKVISFSEWLPIVEGNLNVVVRSNEEEIAGDITGSLYVGDKASGTFTLNKNIVTDGTHTVRASIDLQGVDTASGTSTDPLFSAVQEATRTGATYTGVKTMSWQRSKRCMGCHTQTQGLVGSASAFDKRLGSEFHANALYNSVAGSQQNSGGLSDNQLSRFGRIQTALGVWALTSWKDIKASYRTLYKAGKYMYDRRSQSGNQTWWRPDHVSGWWRSNDSTTAMMVKGYVKLLQGAEQIDLSKVNDYQLSEVANLGAYKESYDTEIGPDDQLYTVKRTGGVVRTNLQTGVTETVVSNLPMLGYGVAVDVDGSIYVSGYRKLLRYNSDGSMETILTASGYLTDVDIGADGLLYVADYSNNRILKVTPSGQVEVLASGGLLNRPYGLTFSDDGQIYIANLNGYNILKLDADKQVTIFADGLPYAPLYISSDRGNGFYFTSNTRSVSGQTTPGAINHLSQNGVMERLQSSNRLFGVVTSPDGRVLSTNYSTNKLYELTTVSLNTDLLVNYREQVNRAVNYYLARYANGTTNNIVQAMRLMGLAEARKVTTDVALNAQIDTAITVISDTLRARQRSDGGWGKYTTYGSDAMVTALVGLSMDYTNPSVDDPMVRNAIIYLLNNQRSDHSWRSNNRILSTNLAATSLVVAYLPVALDRLGGIDVDLSLNFPPNINLSNASVGATATQAQADGSTTYDWELLGITGNGRSVEFDLTFDDMQLNEIRQAANDAHIGFVNSFNDDVFRVDLPIPSLKAKSDTGLSLTTNKQVYTSDEDVTIPLAVVNTGPTSSDTLIELLVRAPGATSPLSTLATVPVGVLEAGAEVYLESNWNTAATLRGDYEVYGRLVDTNGVVLDESQAPFKITLAGSVLNSTVTTDKPLYEAWDQVVLTGRVENVTRNAIQLPSFVEITVRDPSGSVVFTESAQLGELLPEAIRDLPFALTLVDAQSGVYAVEMVVKDALTHQTLNIASTSFQVERFAIQALTGQVEAIPVQVHQGDPAQCTETVQNISTTTLDNLVLISQLVNMDSGEIVNESQRTLSHDGGQSAVDTRTILTDDLPIGAYACVLTAVVDGQTRRLDLAGFDVLEPPIRIEGSLSQGERGRVLVLLDESPKRCEGYTKVAVEAILPTPLTANATVTATLYNELGVMVDQEVGQVDARALDLQSGNDDINLIIDDIAPTHIALSVNRLMELGEGYQLVVEAIDGNVTVMLDSGVIATNCTETLTIGDVYGDMHLSDVDYLSTTNDPLGTNHLPDLDSQRPVVETLLSDAGWSYTIVTSADNFAYELRTGGYVTYLLLSEQVKLDETVQKELREAVYRGEGLVEAGGHDQRQGRIDEALGVKFLGKHASMQGVNTLNNDVTAVGHLDFQLTDRTLKAASEGAIVLATFSQQDDITTEPALTRFDYGQGHSLYVGFDLAAEAAMPNASSLFGDLLLDALVSVHPSSLSAMAQGVYPLRLTLNNLGITTPGQVIMTLPEGVSLVDVKQAAVDGQTVIWPFNLQEEETWGMDVWLNLGIDPITLTALVQSGVAPEWVDQGNLTLDISPSALFTVEAAYLNAIDITDKAYNQVQKYLGWAQQDSIDGQWTDALSALLRASDALIAIDTEQSDSLHVDVAKAIRTVSTKL